MNRLDRKKIARELVKVARDLTSSDPDLEAIAEVVRNNRFMSLKNPLKQLGLRNVDFNTYDPPMPDAMWKMKTRKGKTVAILNKKYADAGSGDIVVGDFIVGYM
jgi:hypothetical protein